MKNRNWRQCILLVMIAAFILTGCGGPKIGNVIPVEKSLYSRGAVREIRPEDVPEYKIGPGDVLKVTVLRHPELSGSMSVGSYGEIRLPESDDVIIAANKTTYQIEDEIASTISSYVKNEPVVIVDMEVFNSKFVYVLGAVENPGKYPLKDRVMTLRDAVFQAGMPVSDAELKKVVIVNPDYDKPIATGINFMEIMYGGRMKYNLVLNERDIVFVPYTSFSKTVETIDRIATPLGKIAGGLADALYIEGEIRNRND